MCNTIKLCIILYGTNIKLCFDLFYIRGCLMYFYFIDINYNLQEGSIKKSTIY